MKTGLAIHLHHNTLVEYCYDYDERVEVIKRDKSQNEQEIRLRLFKLLPQEAIAEIPERVVKADTKWYKADAKWEKVDAKWDKACAERDADAKWKKADAKWKKAYAEWDKACAEREKACAEWKKAYAEWKDKEAWHKKWCGCRYWKDGSIDFSIK